MSRWTGRRDPGGWTTPAWLLAVLLVVPLLAGTPAAAQEEGAQQDDGPRYETAGGGEEAAEGETGEGLPDDLAADEELPDIDEILEGDEAVLGGGGNTYDPGDRRDPFRSLLQARQTGEPEGPRPEGVPGLLIDEISVSGLFRTPSGWVAQVQVSENDKSYLLRVEDQLYDGEVLTISENEVVFKQIVRDPTALKPFRDVVKKLNP